MSSYQPRPSIRPSYNPNLTSTTSTNSNPNPNSNSSSALQARIQSKRAELENLRQLRELSGALAAQMASLEQKLATLRDGTEAVACVLANWDNVLRAIHMASSNVPKPPEETEAELPLTLVRIPVRQNNDERATG